MPYQKGQSGNPGGRPKHGESLRDVLRASIDDDRKKRLADKFYEMAMSGDARAMALLFDNHDGKVPQAIEHTGPDGEPVKFSIVMDTHGDSDE